jgi:hypothetical protein
MRIESGGRRGDPLALLPMRRGKVARGVLVTRDLGDFRRAIGFLARSSYIVGIGLVIVGGVTVFQKASKQFRRWQVCTLTGNKNLSILQNFICSHGASSSAPCHVTNRPLIVGRTVYSLSLCRLLRLQFGC